MKLFDVISGDGPIVLAQPHGGTFVPDVIFARLNARGQELSDTDWHITRLYEGLLEGATVVSSNVHRYVVDANRDPAGISLYPNQNTTSLCPLTDFDGADIWVDGQAPSKDEVEARRAAFHLPYHQALAAELDRVKSRYGIAILYDCHSIRSTIPFLFNGVLPVFSIGTNNGLTCDRMVEESVHQTCLAETDFNCVLNGRFKGGWTTRHYGQPVDGTHAIQMELAQRAYMDEKAPWTYHEDRAARLRAVLQKILKNLDHLARNGELNIEGA